MDNDRVEGKAKDVAGRAQRQVGEWTGDTESQVKGAAKQVEGKIQNAFGKTKDAARDTADKVEDTADNTSADDQDLNRRRA